VLSGEDSGVTEAEIRQKAAARFAPATEGAPRVALFTLAEARRALPYIARVARDASEAFLSAQHCRTSLDVQIKPGHRNLLVRQRDDALHRLNCAIDECNAVGADLIDIAAGIVRFNARVEDRIASLIWRLGEPVESAWIQFESAPPANRAHRKAVSFDSRR